jgi:hypothetical protein
MGDAPSLRIILKRGALVTAANWPVVLVQFIAESLFKLLLGVPVAGGILLVMLVVGYDLDELLVGDVRDMVTAVFTALASRPAALAGFIVAMTIVLLGGSVLMFVTKAGTVATLVDADRHAGAIERPPLRWPAFQHAFRFSTDRFLDACRHFWRRYVRLGLFLLLVYGLSTGLYLVTVVIGFSLMGEREGPEQGAMLWWTVSAALASTILVVWITLVNFVYLLIQMVVVAEDVSVRQAAARTLAFVQTRTRQVAGVFLVLLALVVVATGASIVATTALGLISFVPLVGFAAFPLQALTWFVRGMVFQYLGLTALGSYLTLYRGHA